MYEFLRGAVVQRGEGAAVLEVGGVGYRLACSSSTLRQVPAKGEFKLLTHLVVRDDRQELYGFAQESERYLFRQLLQVSGVGPAVALALLSAYEPAALASHIATGELAFLTRVKGIGKRTAERILVELRDRVKKEGGKAVGRPAVGGVRADAVLALCSLGLARAEAERRVEAVKGADLDLEEVVKQALKA
jgi:Holliday junction DNA helicase RuvA